MAYSKNSDGTYTDLEYTKFPAQIDSWQNNEDLTASMLQIANDYKSALSSGNYANAQSILNANPELKRMMITAEDINKTKHALMALERLFSEDIETYVKSFTDKATSEAEKATSAATSAALSEQNAADSKTTASQKAAEANILLENLKTLKGTLPSDFTEYVQQIVEHNTDSTAHQDIRQAIESSKYTLPAATSTALGGVKIKTGSNITNSSGSLSLTSANVVSALGFTPATSSHTHSYAGSSSAGGTANSTNGFTFAAQTSDPGEGSSLTTNKILFVYK